MPRVADLGNVVEPLASAALALGPCVAVCAGEDGSRLANGDELVVKRAHAIKPLGRAGGLRSPVSAVGRGEDDAVLAGGDETSLERLDAGKDAGGRRLVLAPLLAIARRQHRALAAGNDTHLPERSHALQVVLGRLGIRNLPDNAECVDLVCHRLAKVILSDDIGPRVVTGQQLAVVADSNEQVRGSADAEQDRLSRRLGHDLKIPRGTVVAGQHGGVVAHGDHQIADPVDVPKPVAHRVVGREPI